MYLLRLLSLFFSLSSGIDDALVARLGAEDWRERETADAALRARGLAALPALRRGRALDDPEIRHRCDALYDAAVDDALVALGPLPMLDALWYDAAPPHPGYRKDACPEFQAAYAWFNPYLDRVGRDGYPYRNYYLATNLAVRDLIEAGVPPELLRPVLEEMRRRDAVFLGAARPVGPPERTAAAP
jgi:hypothetical protein